MLYYKKNKPSYYFLFLAEQLGTGQEIFILGIRNNWFWKFAEIEFKERSNCVHVRVAEERERHKDMVQMNVAMSCSLNQTHTEESKFHMGG